ncbi:MAG: hypothetical protein RLZZ628_386 [Bacteroidota bacterium]|jgi:hypothetical protein
MPKPGYLTSIDKLNIWFNSDGNQEFNRFEIRETNENGKVISQYDAPTHAEAWINCEKIISLFHGGLFWVRFFAGKGNQSGVGLDLSPIGNAKTDNTPTIGSALTKEEEYELWRFRYEAQQKKKAGVGGFVLDLFDTPEAKRELAEGIKGLVGLLPMFLPNKMSGVGIHGFCDSEEVARINVCTISEPREMIVNCKSFMLCNNGDVAYMDGARINEYMSFERIGKRFNQKIRFSKSENGIMDITLITID